MRVFTDKERELLDRLLNTKKSGEYQNLHFSNLLLNVLDSLALHIYNTERQKTISIYSTFEVNSNDEKCWFNVVDKFNKILDLIYFIEELEKYNLIKLQVNTWEDTPEMATSLLYDRSLYGYDINGFFNKETKEKLKVVHNPKRKNMYCYVDLLDKYVNKVIYPTSLLEDLANNKYRSIEERRFQKQLCRTNLSVIIAAIAVIAPFVYNKYWDDSPNHSDMQNIKYAILQKKTITIDSIAKYNADTINVNITNKPQLQPIDVKATIVPNQKKN